MAGVIVSLGGKAIKQPSDLAIGHFNLTKSGRTSAGRMVMDLIAKKRKFNFAYEVLSGADLEDIMSVINSSAMFFQLVYIENNIQKSATVYVGEINYKKFRSRENGWYWKDVTFNLIEQ